jgi:hypothetical protein
MAVVGLGLGSVLMLAPTAATAAPGDQVYTNGTRPMLNQTGCKVDQAYAMLRNSVPAGYDHVTVKTYAGGCEGKTVTAQVRVFNRQNQEIYTAPVAVKKAGFYGTVAESWVDITVPAGGYGLATSTVDGIGFHTYMFAGGRVELH